MEKISTTFGPGTMTSIMMTIIIMIEKTISITIRNIVLIIIIKTIITAQEEKL